MHKFDPKALTFPNLSVQRTIKIFAKFIMFLKGFVILIKFVIPSSEFDSEIRVGSECLSEFKALAN